LHIVSKSNSRSLTISIIGALVNPNIDERLKDVEGDPQIVNRKSLNG
jgi:hypothetical protein